MPGITRPKFSERFRRLCQVAAIAETTRTEEVIEGLLAVAMAYGNGPWRDAGDWAAAVNDLFGLDVPQAEILAAVARMSDPNGTTLMYDVRTGTYTIAAQTRREVLERIAAGSDLERRAQSSWLAEIESTLSSLPSKALWSCLIEYTGLALVRHGSEAVELIGGTAEDDLDDDASDNDGSVATLLLASMRANGIDAAEYDHVAAAVATFFDGKDADRVQYVVQLTDSVFNFLSINVDEEIRKTLMEGLPSLTIFLDTNVIYGLMGAHSQPLAAASADLLRAIQENAFPFKTYYHEKTLSELQRTIESVGRRLTKAQWTPAASAGLLAAPRLLTSIEVKYHQQNVRTRTPPGVFLDRYSNIPGLLADLGLSIYRTSTAGESEEASRMRYELVAEYEAFAKENAGPSRRYEKSYETLDHDMTVWLAASSRRRPTGKSPLFVGSLVLSADFLLRKFDRQLLTKSHGSGIPTIVMPDTLFRALRPFMASASNFDRTFVEVFATPEFMGLNRSMNDARLNVAAYLSTYEDLAEETATKLLTNAMLMNRVKHFDGESDELRAAVDAALVEENDVLLRERDQARSEAHRQSSAAQETAAFLRRDVEELRSTLEGKRDSDIADLLSSLEARISNLEQRPSVSIGIKAGGVVAEGDHYENKYSQIGAQGRDAKASGTTQNMDARRIDVDPTKLVEELEQLRAYLVSEAREPAHYEAIANVVAASAAIAQSDQDGALSKLRQAGSWVLNAARDIGTEIAAAAISKSMGL
jgi:hypothetical protein